MSNQNEWTRDQRSQAGRRGRSHSEKANPKEIVPGLFQLGVGLTRAAPYPHQRLKNRFISKASLRQSM